MRTDVRDPVALTDRPAPLEHEIPLHGRPVGLLARFNASTRPLSVRGDPMGRPVGGQAASRRQVGCAATASAALPVRIIVAGDFRNDQMLDLPS